MIYILLNCPLYINLKKKIKIVGSGIIDLKKIFINSQLVALAVNFIKDSRLL
jgi:hypothetical protein